MGGATISNQLRPEPRTTSNASYMNISNTRSAKTQRTPQVTPPPHVGIFEADTRRDPSGRDTPESSQQAVAPLSFEVTPECRQSRAVSCERFSASDYDQ